MSVEVKAEVKENKFTKLGLEAGRGNIYYLLK